MMNPTTEMMAYEFYFNNNNNTTNYYENTSETFGEYTCDTLEASLRLYHKVFQPLFYSVAFLLGLIGNGLLLMILMRRRAHLRMTDLYLLHLALADLLLLLTLPFGVTKLIYGWLFGDFLCRIVGLLHRLNLLCSSLLLACIGFDRYLAVVHAVSSLRTRRPRMVNFICAMLWLFCLAVALPDAIFLSVKPKRNDQTQLQCYFNDHGAHAYIWSLVRRLLTHLLCFLLPLVIMGYCYTCVVFTLYHSQQSLQKQGAIRLALIVTLVFCLCWLPYNITLFVDTLVKLKVLDMNCQAHGLLAQGLLVTESIGFIHCCINPILYAFVGVRFRKELLQLLVKHLPGFSTLLYNKKINRMSVSEPAPSTTSTQNI